MEDVPVSSGWRGNREARRALERENVKWPTMLRQIPREDWPLTCQAMMHPPAEVWRSSGFLVQVYAEAFNIERLTVCRTAVDCDRWKAEISWDDLQRLKRECGRGDKDAVEVYPADRDVVNVANMRHLWVMDLPLDFIWRAS